MLGSWCAYTVCLNLLGSGCNAFGSNYSAPSLPALTHARLLGQHRRARVINDNCIVPAWTHLILIITLDWVPFIL